MTKARKILEKLGIFNEGIRHSKESVGDSKYDFGTIDKDDSMHPKFLSALQKHSDSVTPSQRAKIYTLKNNHNKKINITHYDHGAIKGHILDMEHVRDNLMDK